MLFSWKFQLEIIRWIPWIWGFACFIAIIRVSEVPKDSARSPTSNRNPAKEDGLSPVAFIILSNSSNNFSRYFNSHAVGRNSRGPLVRVIFHKNLQKAVLRIYGQNKKKFSFMFFSKIQMMKVVYKKITSKLASFT